jgi:S-sulfo-L-cysteine synthase (O-acetyl-L-serine-dependent)
LIFPSRLFFEKDYSMKKLLDVEPILAVKLPRELNPLEDKEGVDLIAMDAPRGTLKESPALNMLEEAMLAGKFRKTSTVIVPTSGNFGKCVLKHAKRFGVKKVVIVTPTDLAPKKTEVLNFLGAEIISVPSGALVRAKEEAKKNKWFLLNQYSDDNNWKAHEQNLGPRVWEQTQGQVSVFAAVMGTTGTVTGVSRYLKAQNSNVFVLGVNLLPGEEVPGARDLARIKKEITLPWQDSVDNCQEVGAKESYASSFDLCRLAGLNAGPSSGSAYLGLVRFLLLQEAHGSLDKLRNKHGRVVAVFACPDGPEAYLEKYFTWLPARKFQY